MFGGLFAPEAVEPGWFGLDSYYATAWFDEESADTSSEVGSSRNAAPLPHIGLLLDFTPVLTADAGSFALTGVAATFSRPDRALAGAAGAYTWTGVAASLDATIAPTLPAHARPGLFSADAVKPGWFEPSIYSDVVWFDKEYGYLYSVGAPAYLPSLSTLYERYYVLDGSDVPAFMRAYNINEQDAILRTTRYFPLAAGSYNYTGVAAGLSYSSVNSSRNAAPLPSLGLLLDYSNRLTADAGSYAITGTATLKAGRILTGAAASYTLTGSAATLTKSGTATPLYPGPLPQIGMILTGAGATNSTSYPAPLPSMSSIMGMGDGIYAMSGGTGLFTWTGIAAAFRHGYALTAESGSYVTDFSRVARDHQLTASAGSFALSGVAAAGARAVTLTASAGSFAITGVDAGLRYEQAGTYLLTGLLGIFVVEGQDAALSATDRTLSAEAGQFRIDGIAASYLLNGAPPVETPTGGAGGKSKGRRRRHILEVEGEVFEVESQEHAIEILKALQKVAAQAIAKAQKPPKPPRAKVIPPRVPSQQSERFSQRLQQQVDATNAILAKMYADAIQEETELEELMTLGVL